MKFTVAHLQEFLSALPAYELLPKEARRALAAIEHPSLTCSSDDLGVSLEALIETGFVIPLAARRCSFEPSRQSFIRVLRMLKVHQVLRNPTETVFTQYIEEHLDAAERSLMLGKNPNSWERRYILFRRVTAPDWVEDFLSATNSDWERPYVTARSTDLLANEEVLRAAQTIIRTLLDRGGSARLCEVLPANELELLGFALHAGLRYALLFAALDPDTLDIMTGVWPAIARYLAVAAPPPPRNAVPVETFERSFLAEDLTVFVLACAKQPFKLKANDRELFAKNVHELADSLRPLPDWVEDGFQMESETRLRTTVSYARTFRLVEDAHPLVQMRISPLGRKWLDLSAGARHRVLLDGVMDRMQHIEAFWSFQGARIGAVAPKVQVRTSMKSLPDMNEAALQPFRSLQGGGFFPIEEVVNFCRTANPLLGVFRADKSASFQVEYAYLDRPDAEKLQQTWAGVIRDFLRSRLLPLGVVRVGRSQDGLSIAITPAGRYFLGQTDEWVMAETVDAQVIVQPNFEVTFLGEAAGAEAEISRFAERRGQQLGALFQITKKSIFAAAAAGMTAEAVLAILERVCSRPVPANVRREIAGWFAQCRKVSFESAIIIRCPDRETALRIAGLAKGFATALSDTVLEYREAGNHRRAMMKKLREMGVLIEELDKSPERFLQKPWRW